MKVALIQAPCMLGDKKANLLTIEERIREVEADLYVFCETFITGYMVRDRFAELAETLEGETVEELTRLSREHGGHILVGMPLWDAELPGILRNSAVGVSPDGKVQRYDKLFLANFGPFEEKIYFEQGSAPSLFEFGGFRMGITICYDLFFPELTKHYAMKGADAVVCISAAPNTSRSLFERLIPARAVENTLYMIYVNQVGTQLNQVFHGGSQAYSPRGETLARCGYYSSDIGLIDIDRADIQIARKLRPTLRNTMASSWCAGFWAHRGAGGHPR
jgi:5-aminopentanamidase